MSRLPSISAFTPTSSGWGFFLCSDKWVRAGRGGGEYIGLTLVDASGSVQARVFENVDRLRDEFSAGEFVKVQGRANPFNGKLQFLVEHIRRVMLAPDSSDRRDGFQEESLIASAPRPADDMWRELQDIICAVSNVHLKQLLEYVTRTYEQKFRIWPAARVVHHAYRSGFLEHVVTMATAGRMLAKLYEADADLVVTGALLHDIGKLEELEYDVTTTYSRDGNLLGHIAQGTLLLHDACRHIPGFPDVLRTEVSHLILSHHGAKEYGAPVEPMTAEAFILATVDDLDSKLNQVRRAIREDDATGEFTSYNARLGRVFWKGPQK